MKLLFEQWLQQELAKPITNHYYNPNGNSSRAVMCRTLTQEFIIQCKDLFPSLYSDIKYCWNGWSTSIDDVLKILLLPFIFWLLPFTRTYGVRKRAMNNYKRGYGWYLKKEEG